jgi:O-antigen ligase
MPTLSLASFKKIYFKNKLKFLELTSLSLFLGFLPSFEAPKNIFLAGYLVVALYRQSQILSPKWGVWDWVFLSLIFSSLLSALFPFVSGGFEWKGFRGMLLWVTFGWTLFRSDYNFNEKKYLFIFSILMVIPPLIWGLTELLVLHTKEALQLHSVGVVNHSAIYLCIIFGASLTFFVNQFKTERKRNIFLISLLLIFLIYASIVSESRGAFAIEVLLGFLIIFLSHISKKNKVIFTCVFGVLIAFLIFLMPAILEKQLDHQDRSDILNGRTKIWLTSLEIAKLNPLFGIGNGNWKVLKIDQIKAEIESRNEFFNMENFILVNNHPHNIYLSNLVDRGILGFIIFLNFMLIWLITLINSYKKFNQDSKAMLFIMGSFSAWATIFGVGFVNTTFHHENALLALFFLSLHLNYLRQKNQLKLFN